MVFKTESDVRVWINKLGNLSCGLKCSVDWVEPTKGSTSGYPDVTLSVSEDGREIIVPIELKCWGRSKHGRSVGCFHMRFEPTQVRWHHQAAKAGKKALILWAEKDTDKLWCITSSHAPKRIWDTMPQPHQHVYSVGIEHDAFLHDLINQRFWWQEKNIRQDNNA